MDNIELNTLLLLILQRGHGEVILLAGLGLDMFSSDEDCWWCSVLMLWSRRGGRVMVRVGPSWWSVSPLHWPDSSYWSLSNMMMNHYWSVVMVNDRLMELWRSNSSLAYLCFVSSVSTKKTLILMFWNIMMLDVGFF